MVKLVVTDKDGRDVEVDARPGLSIMENIRQLPRSVEEFPLLIRKELLSRYPLDYLLQDCIGLCAVVLQL